MNQNTINSEKFLEAFNQIELTLNNRFRPGFHMSFSELVRRLQSQDAVLKRFANDLREFAELRNAIVHTRRENFVIAEPHIDVVNEIVRIMNLIVNPPTINTLPQRNVATATKHTLLKEVLITFEQKNFTRCPIIDNQQIVGLLTARSVARWLASSVNEISDFNTVSVGQILPWAEKEKYAIVNPRTKIHDVYELFKTQLKGGNSLQAIIVTKSGKPTLPIYTILTASDLPHLFSLIDNQPST